MVILLSVCPSYHLRMIFCFDRGCRSVVHNYSWVDNPRRSCCHVTDFGNLVSETDLDIDYAFHHHGCTATGVSCTAALVHMASCFCCMVNWDLMSVGSIKNTRRAWHLSTEITLSGNSCTIEELKKIWKKAKINCVSFGQF